MATKARDRIFGHVVDQPLAIVQMLVWEPDPADTGKVRLTIVQHPIVDQEGEKLVMDVMLGWSDATSLAEHLSRAAGLGIAPEPDEAE